MLCRAGARGLGDGWNGPNDCARGQLRACRLLGDGKGRKGAQGPRTACRPAVTCASPSWTPPAEKAHHHSSSHSVPACATTRSVTCVCVRTRERARAHVLSRAWAWTPVSVMKPAAVTEVALPKLAFCCPLHAYCYGIPPTLCDRLGSKPRRGMLNRGRHQQKIRFPIHRPTPSPLARPRALQAAPSPVVVNTTTW